MNILFLCTGNTCRSPMAEGLTRYLNDEFHTEFLPLSAGFRAFPGMKVMKEAVKAVQDKVDISRHKARSLAPVFVDAANVVVTMTEDQKAMFAQEYPDFKGKLFTLKELAHEEGDVDDPYAHPQFVYDRCAQQIEDLLRKGWPTLQELDTP